MSESNVNKLASSPLRQKMLTPRPVLSCSESGGESSDGSDELFSAEGDMLDRYGYKIPPKLLKQYLEWLEETKNENAARVEAFAHILYSIGQPYFDLDASELFREGIPPNMRRTMYLQVTGVGNTRARNPTHYAKLLVRCSESKTTDREQIAKDITRTFGNNAKLSNEASQRKLSNILNAYALHNTHVGYSQGMSFIVLGLLLLDFDEEEAFWMLDYIVGMLPDCYDRSLLGVRADVEVLDYYIRAKMPRLSAFFLRNYIDVEMHAVPFFMCLYVGYLPYETLFRLWDRIMFSGPLELFRGALKLYYAVEEQVLKLDGLDLDVIVNGLIGAHLNLFDADAVFGRMPGTQKLDAGQLALRRMRTRERMRTASVPKVGSPRKSSLRLSAGNFDTAAAAVTNTTFNIDDDGEGESGEGNEKDSEDDSDTILDVEDINERTGDSL